jgi:type II secretory pathway pseudopilin PulG
LAGDYDEKIRTTAGFALIDVLFVCGIIGIISAIAVPRLVMAKQAAGAASAIGSLRAINSGQLTFALTCGGGFYAPNLVSLGMPPSGSTTPFVSSSLTSSNRVSRSGYVIQVEGGPFAGAPPACNGLGAGATSQGFKAGADAIDPDNFRYFGSNATGSIYEHSATLYGGMPEFGVPVAGHVLQ